MLCSLQLDRERINTAELVVLLWDNISHYSLIQQMSVWKWRDTILKQITHLFYFLVVTWIWLEFTLFWKYFLKLIFVATERSDSNIPSKSLSLDPEHRCHLMHVGNACEELPCSFGILISSTQNEVSYSYWLVTKFLWLQTSAP